MKPRLLKFTCHSCGARLAVPPEMAGLSDQCPKCGVVVTAPAAPSAAPAPAPAAAPEKASPAPQQIAAPPVAQAAPAATTASAPPFSPPKAPEVAGNDAQAQMAALQKMLGAKPDPTSAPGPGAAPADAHSQVEALQKRLAAKPAPASAPVPAAAAADAQAQVEALQMLLGAKSPPAPSPQQPPGTPGQPARPAPEDWSSDALADALKPGRSADAPVSGAASTAPEGPPKNEPPPDEAPAKAPPKKQTAVSETAPFLFGETAEAPEAATALTAALPSAAAAVPPTVAGPPTAESAKPPSDTLPFFAALSHTVPEVAKAPPATAAALPIAAALPPASTLPPASALPPASVETASEIAPTPPATVPPDDLSTAGPANEKNGPEPPATPVEPPVEITAPPAPAKAQVPSPVSRKPAHEILDSILRRKEPGRPVSRVREKPAESEALPGQDDPHALLAHEPRTALVPQHVTDAQDAKKAAMPGMGEVLASTALQPMTSTVPESRPLLHVPLVPVLASAADQRRARVTHLRNMGIICFLLMDVLLITLAVLYRQEIAAWWKGNPAPAAVAVDQPAAAPAAPPAVPDAPVIASSAPSLDDPAVSPELTAPATAAPMSPESAGENLAANAATNPATPAATPLASAALAPSSPNLTPAPSSGSLTAESPSELSSSANPKPVEEAVGSPEVPMAIPLPGKAEETMPNAAGAMPTSPAAPQPLLPKDDLAVTMPPVPPLPELAVPTIGAGALAAASSSPTTAPGSSLESVPPAMAPIVNESPAPAVPDPTPSTSESASSGAEGPVAPPKRVGKVPAEAKTAIDVLEKFLAAPTWKDRLAYVQKPDTVRAAMEKHAATFGDGPIRAGAIDFLERYPSKAGVPPYCMFEVSGGELEHPVLTLVEQSPKDGTRVDWETFADFKDDLLLRFLEKKGSPPQRFRGLLRRKHYFDKDVPDIASKDSFQLVQPNAHFEGHVFVPRASAVGKQLANQLPWGQDMPVIAELVWKSDAKAWWVQIENIVSYGWRG